MEHNLSICRTRMWGAIATQAAYDAAPEGSSRKLILRDFAAFEARRYQTACYALGTSIAANKEI